MPLPKTFTAFRDESNRVTVTGTIPTTKASANLRISLGTLPSSGFQENPQFVHSSVSAQGGQTVTDYFDNVPGTITTACVLDNNDPNNFDYADILSSVPPDTPPSI